MTEQPNFKIDLNMYICLSLPVITWNETNKSACLKFLIFLMIFKILFYLTYVYGPYEKISLKSICYILEMIRLWFYPAKISKTVGDQATKLCYVIKLIVYIISKLFVTTGRQRKLTKMYFLLFKFLIKNLKLF